MDDSQALEQQLAMVREVAERLPLLLQLGHLYDERGDVPNMARCFYEASTIDPRSLAAVHGCRRAYLRAQKWEASIAWFHAELRLQPDLEARAALLSELGDLRRNQFNDPEGAQTFYGQASQLLAEAKDRARPAPPPTPAASVTVHAPAPEVAQPKPVVLERDPAPRLSIPVWPLLLVLLVGGGTTAWWKFRPKPKCPPGQLHRTDGFLLPEHLGDVARAEGCWSSSQRVGLHQFFSDAGVQTATIQYLAGFPEGPATWVALDGGYESGLNAAGQRTGEWLTRNSAGELVARATYRNGLRDGPERIFFPDGGIHIEGTWAAGLQEGDWSQYYEDGKVWMRGSFKAGNPTLRWQRFDRSGAFVWVTPEVKGPRALRSAGSLFAGRTLAWWNIRLAELRTEAQRAPDDAAAQARLMLTLKRATLCDLELSPTTQMLQPVVISE